MNTLRKHTQNVIVDTVSFVCMIILTVTGFLIHYKLPKGSHGATVWGLSRHDWGALHFWVAVVLMAAVAIHLVLHIPWIKGVVYPNKAANKNIRLALYIIAFCLVIGIGIMLLISPVTAR